MGLFPKNVQFFDLFEKAAVNMVQAAHLLEGLVQDFNQVEVKLKKIEDVEHCGDQITHDTIETLNKTFITPFDREDIHQLASELDDIVDLIFGAANKMILYKIGQPTEGMKKITGLLVRSVEEANKAIIRLREHKSPEMILAQCIEVNRIENEADEASRAAIALLFEREKDPIRLIKEKEILETLETATDRCEDLANVLEGIVLKNA
ncbi:MAG: DUF47 domain-containing protein [Deltaproteobacteria bacterium]|nr:DUF47 domain-containing protein [Deltaproteobacteria bacterium]